MITKEVARDALQGGQTSQNSIVKANVESTFQLGLTILENEVTLMGKTFNVYGTMEEPLFMAKDVADWIEHSDVHKMVQSVDDDEKLTGTLFLSGQNRETWLLTENGVYEVLMLSRKPIAKEFKKEVKKLLHALRTKKATLMPTNFADALEAYAKEVRAREEAQQALFAETQQKLLALEQKEAAEAETESIKQYNKNFHNNLYTATDIAEMLDITPNRVGREARKHNLKQEPLYGKLGKVQLNNGKWVDQFYYNDDALRVIKAICNR